ncbi:mitochondrial outer membrane protein 25 [Holotrichia oblita]|uniref:Mitochondrial outer membrane protein 25 n=2 Tax=Holotrichia oblita TaxID=644536 RepID=A0ACB9SYI2_HOLOL|nr:mitochondrial outer membrane protein 25 [Holotrichia oblita]KAI4459577.1 mitochondrial outer membrane protein 25 [Holotrichia oblita]
MTAFSNKLLAILNRKSVKYAVPFFILVVGGSFGLKEFAKLRYQFSQISPVRKEAEKLGIQMKNPSDITLEKEYEKLKQLDIDNWEQIRGPRPWEENFSENEK